MLRLDGEVWKDRGIDRQSQLNGEKGMCTEREMDTDRLTDKYDKKIDIQIRQIERKIDRWVDSKREWKMENKIGLDQSWRKRPVLLVGKKGQSVKPTNYCYRVYSHRCRKKRYRLGIAKSVYCTGRRSKIPNLVGFVYTEFVIGSPRNYSTDLAY